MYPQMTLYDTAGMERFEGTVPPTYFRNAKAVIMVYAINNEESIGDLQHWSESLSIQRIGAASQSIIKILVGNKADLTGEREVDRNRGMETAELCGVSKDMFFEVSAKTGEGVWDMFNAIGKKLKHAGKAEGKPGLPPLQERRQCCSK